MTHLQIFSCMIYVLSLQLCFLALWVIKYRRQYKIYLGEGQAPMLLANISAQNNFTHYVPFTLVLFMLMMTLKIHIVLYGVLACLFILGRLCHSIGICYAEPVYRYYRLRVWGMQCTISVIMISSSIIAYYQIT